MKLLLILLVGGLAPLAYGQTSLKGKVITSESNEPLPAAHVKIEKGASKSTITDKTGNFAFQSVEDGEYLLTVTYVGFEKFSDTITVKNDRTLTISLLPGQIQLADVVIDANANRSINFLSPVDIKLRPANTSQDILRMVPGLFIAQHAGGGKAEQIFLRGFDIDHGTDINLSVDGLPVNMVSHAHGQGYSDLHFVIPELIGYVDFNKGPYYADKGDFTTAGFVEFHTKNYLDRNFLKVEGGRFSTWRSVGAVNLIAKKDGPSSAYVAGEVFGSQGYFESPQDFSRFNLVGKFNSKLGVNDYININASYFDSKWDASGQIPERAVSNGLITRFGYIDNTEGGNTSRSNFSVKHNHQFRSGADLTQQLFTTYYAFDLYSNFTFFLNDSINGDQINQREGRQIYGYKASYNSSRTFIGMPSELEVGVGIRYDNINNISLSRTIKRTFLFHKHLGDLDQVNISAYVKQTIKPSEKWAVSFAARIDNLHFKHYDELEQTNRYAKATIASPKVNVNYQLSNSLAIYAKAGSGFHSNDARAVTASGANDVLPKAYGVDVGINAKINERLLLNAAIWRLDMEQEFIYVGDEGIVEQGGRTKREGLDLSVRSQVLSWLFFDGDVNITRPRLKDAEHGSHYIPLAPSISGVGGFSVQTKGGLNASLRSRYLADRPANEDYSMVAAGYFLADVVLNYSFKNFDFQVTAENIFDAEWNEAQFATESMLKNESDSTSEIHFTPGAPRFLKFGITILF